MKKGMFILSFVLLVALGATQVMAQSMMGWGGGNGGSGNWQGMGWDDHTWNGGPMMGSSGSWQNSQNYQGSSGSSQGTQNNQGAAGTGNWTGMPYMANYQSFLGATPQDRADTWSKWAEYNTLITQANPDLTRLGTLAKEIHDLERKLQAAAQASMGANYQKFLDSTAKLRTDLAAKQTEYNTLLSQPAPDLNRLVTLAQTINDLRTEIQAEAQSFGAVGASGYACTGFYGPDYRDWW